MTAKSRETGLAREPGNTAAYRAVWLPCWLSQAFYFCRQESPQSLEHEKKNTAERIEKGVTSIMPIGLVVKTVKGTEKEDMNMATGDYNDRIDKSIAAIKKACNLN